MVEKSREEVVEVTGEKTGRKTPEVQPSTPTGNGNNTAAKIMNNNH